MQPFGLTGEAGWYDIDRRDGVERNPIGCEKHAKGKFDAVRLDAIDLPHRLAGGPGLVYGNRFSLSVFAHGKSTMIILG